MQDVGALEEPLLETDFPEDSEALLDVDELEGMLASDIDGAFDEGKCGECAAELVDLKKKIM